MHFRFRCYRTPGFNFAPRVKDLKDRKLYAIETSSTYPLLEPLIGGTTAIVAITSQWPMLMRLKASIEAGALLPSTILRKLAAAGLGNALSRALRAIGRIERTLFTLQWLSDPELRQRSHAGLNKGEASNALRRAVFFHRQGEIRDRTCENQNFGTWRRRRGAVAVPSWCRRLGAYGPMHPWCFLRGSFSHHGDVTGAAGTTGALVHMLTPSRVLGVGWTWVRREPERQPWVQTGGVSRPAPGGSVSGPE